MGSGYGVALILKTSLLEQPLVIPTELGHVQFPGQMENDENYADEHGLTQFVSDALYGGVHAPEYEDIASGRGIVLGYKNCIKKRTGKIPTEEIDAGKIAQLARSGHDAAKKAIKLAHLYFTRSAKAIATSLSCDSVVLALDNQVKDWDLIRTELHELQKEFYSWIRPTWLSGIRVYTQVKTLNFNILGTDYMAHRLADKA
jgi:glucokinase